MKTIGILGGLGPESTLAYYAAITRMYYERRGDYAYPEIIIYSLTFSKYINRHYEMADGVRAAIEALARAGADFAVAACNSVHIVYDEVARGIPIPWVSIIDATAERIKERGMKRVGLLGTIFTMGKGFYQAALARHGVEAVTPSADAQGRINDIIYGELVRNIVTDRAREYVVGCMKSLAQEGAQGIVLGCTELPFLISQEHADIPVFDTTAIHTQKALDLALGEEA